MGVAVSGCGYNKRVHHWLGNCRDDALSSIQECTVVQLNQYILFPRLQGTSGR